MNALAEESVDDLFVLKVAVFSYDHGALVFLGGENRTCHYGEGRHAARSDVSGLGIVPRSIDKGVAKGVLVVFGVEMVIALVVRGIFYDFPGLCAGVRCEAVIERRGLPIGRNKRGCS